MKRLSLQHHISVLTLKGKLHFSPIREDGKILDLGTGNGIFKKQSYHISRHVILIVGAVCCQGSGPLMLVKNLKSFRLCTTVHN